MDLEYIKNIGIKAAYNGAVVLRGYLGRLDTIDKKGPDDLVTCADIESEKEIIKTIRQRFSDHEILAEESGRQPAKNSDCMWIIDPLDGTTNFAHQVPVFAVSIAFSHLGEISCGIVLNPVSGELFTAVKGKGAQLNGNPVKVSGQKEVPESLLATGFSYDVKKDPDPVMARFKRCLMTARGLRRPGSAALDLCFVACGRYDGFWEEGLKPWDTAAGALMAREAGGIVTDFSGRPHDDLNQKEILATNGHIHEQMYPLLMV